MLKKLRIQKGWTLQEVSRRTGYPVSTLSKIENDRVSLTYDKLTRISAGLEVDFASLFGAQEAAPARYQHFHRRPSVVSKSLCKCRVCGIVFQHQRIFHSDVDFLIHEPPRTTQ